MLGMRTRNISGGRNDEQGHSKTDGSHRTAPGRARPGYLYVVNRHAPAPAPDMTMLRISSQPVHFKNGAGEWEDIDLTVHPITASDAQGEGYGYGLEELIVDRPEVAVQMVEVVKRWQAIGVAWTLESDGGIRFTRQGSDEALWHIPRPVMYELNDPEERDYGENTIGCFDAGTYTYIYRAFFEWSTVDVRDDSKYTTGSIRAVGLYLHGTAALPSSLMNRVVFRQLNDHLNLYDYLASELWNDIGPEGGEQEYIRVSNLGVGDNYINLGCKPAVTGVCTSLAIDDLEAALDDQVNPVFHFGMHTVSATAIRPMAQPGCRTRPLSSPPPTRRASIMPSGPGTRAASPG